MSDNVMNKMPRTVSSAAENDNINIDEALIYENALKNLQREIEEKQQILSNLQVKISPQSAFGASLMYQRNYDENDYLKNKDAAQRIKDQAADVLIGELKSITSNLKRKLSDIDEKERKISSRLIELEERQAILEEIDYVQRMIPKKIIEENINRSVQTKQELNIDIEDMFKPAVNVIADKTINKQTKGIKILNEDKKDAMEFSSQQDIIQEESAEIKPKEAIKEEIKQEMPAKIELPPEIKKAILEKIKSSQAEPKKEILHKDKIELMSESELPLQEAKKESPDMSEAEKQVMKIAAQPKSEKIVTWKPAVEETNNIAAEEQIDNINKREEIKPQSEIIKKEPIIKAPMQKSKPQRINPAAANMVSRDAKSKISINAKPERKGMHIQERNWKNFAYIKDSKVKLKQDDLLNISKTIMDIEQGKFSLKGI